jgi:hypothetical protein
MKLLVSGCSFSSGYGFESLPEKNWASQVAEQLGATLKNVACTGYDNTGICLNFLEQITKEDFDICLLQITSIDRVILSPNWNGAQLVSSMLNISNGFLSNLEYQHWFKKFALLNQHSEHWQRLLKFIHIVQNLSNQGKYIRFVNGLLDWDKELFNNPKESKFLNRLIDIDQLQDSDIPRLRKLVHSQTKSIDLNLWINPFNNFDQLRVDRIANEDPHPGLKSHDLYAKLITNYLKDNMYA